MAAVDIDAMKQRATAATCDSVQSRIGRDPMNSQENRRKRFAMKLHAKLSCGCDALSRLDALIGEGVTTIEIKSGYGLNTETEIRQLSAARSLAAALRQHRVADTERLNDA